MQKEVLVQIEASKLKFRMEPLTIAVDELKRLVETAKGMAHGLLSSGRRSPVCLQFRFFCSFIVFDDEMFFYNFNLVFFV